MPVSTLERTGPAVSVDQFDRLTAGLVPHSFPSVDDVQSAADLLRLRHGMHVGDVSDGAHLAYLALSPGTVAVRLRDVGRMDLSDGLDVDALERLAGAASTGLEEPAQGALFDLEAPSGPRRAITEWSRGSRRRMVRTIAELDYSGWADDGGVLAMVTFTLPGAWELVAPTGQSFKGLIDVFRKRWIRKIGPWRGLWKLEFQERGAPHMHTLMRVPATVGGERFEHWLSQTWADVCLAGIEDDDVRHAYEAAGEYGRHVLAGTGVDFSGVKFSDPRRTAIYFLKHSAKTTDNKEYQHIVPDWWQGEGAGPGRFWGVWGLRRAVVEVIVDWRTMVHARRVLRHVAKAGRSAATISRLRAADEREAIWAMPRQRVPSLTTAGGWVLVNDGLALAYDLGRYLDQL